MSEVDHGVPPDIDYVEPTESGTDFQWQFSLRALLGLTAIVSAGCALTVWLGAPFVLVFLGASVGAFVGGLFCPWMGLEDVLGHVRTDVIKCFALGFYLVGGAVAAFAAIGWLIFDIHGDTAPVMISGGMVLFFLFTVMLMAKQFWAGIDSVEASTVVAGSLLGVLAMVWLIAMWMNA